MTIAGWTLFTFLVIEGAVRWTFVSVTPGGGYDAYLACLKAGAQELRRHSNATPHSRGFACRPVWRERLSDT